MDEQILARALGEGPIVRAARTQAFLASLGTRERRLMREVAVMAFLQGREYQAERTARRVTGDDHPKDTWVFEHAVTEALAIPDLYPVIALVEEDPTASLIETIRPTTGPHTSV